MTLSHETFGVSIAMASLGVYYALARSAGFEFFKDILCTLIDAIVAYGGHFVRFGIL